MPITGLLAPIAFAVALSCQFQHTVQGYMLLVAGLAFMYMAIIDCGGCN
jgi:hypothetical protein